MRKNQGFTLIELIAVIAILAILAATAIPQFVDLRSQARVAATQGVAGSLSSASAMNYAKKVATGAAVQVHNCNEIKNVVTAGGFTIVDSATPTAGQYGLLAATTVAAGASVTCTLYSGDDGGATNVTFGAVGSDA
jgi:MSHA pilin protein MshA